MTRRNRHYTRASDVTVIDADSGEIVDNQPAYDPVSHRNIVASGNKKSDPSRRAANRRNYTN